MKYCCWYTETPRYERCMNIAVPGTSRCSEHPVKKRKRAGGLTAAQKAQVKRSFGNRCAVPGCTRPGHDVDHIVELNEFPPDEKWKANLPSNLQLLCFEHHLLKTNSYRRSLVSEPEPDDRSTSARNRKKLRRKARGY